MDQEQIEQLLECVENLSKTIKISNQAIISQQEVIVAQNKLIRQLHERLRVVEIYSGVLN